MTAEKHDPWALLAEIHELQPWLSQDADLAARVESALAERQDSATDEVEWRPADQRVFLDGVSLRIVYQTGGLWMWSVYWPLSHRTQQGQVATEAEAKSAAIAAARGME
jgi:hypothetical protein